MSKEIQNRKSERGSAGVKFLAVVVVLYLAGHAAFNYIPAAYESENFKQEMQTAVVQSIAMPTLGATPVEALKAKLRKAAANNNIPSDALFEVKQVSNSIQARVVFTKQIEILPFGLFSYNYHFDYTATPTGFLYKEDKSA